MPDTAVDRILNDTAGRSEPRMRYVSAAVVTSWRADFALKKQETEQLDWQGFQKSWISDIRPMMDAGVLLLAGTDVGSPLVFPAFSLHDELDAMVNEAKLTPLEALRTATVNPAIYLHDDNAGVVAAGKRADLVFLDANPLTEIQNVHRIRAVMRGGKLLDRKALDALLDSARQR